MTDFPTSPCTPSLPFEGWYSPHCKMYTIHFRWYTLFNSIHATTGLIIHVCSAGNNSHGEKMYANICTVKLFCKQKVEQQTADTHSDSHLALVRFLSRFSVICNAQGSPLLLCLTDDYSNCLAHVYVSR